MKLLVDRLINGSCYIVGDDGSYVAMVYDEHEKLAKLMASAPQLLEALEELKYSISYRAAQVIEGDAAKIGFANDKVWRAVDKADKAIAKAKGE